MSAADQTVYRVGLPGGDQVRHGEAALSELLREYMRARRDDPSLARVEVYELPQEGDSGAGPIELGRFIPELAASRPTTARE